MRLDQLIVTASGGLLAAFTLWFFLMKRERVVEARGSVDITVEGGYTPQAITIPIGATTTLRFTRKDPSTCLEEVVLPDFKIRRQLPLGQVVEIALTPKQRGSFRYSCGMNMYHGTIVVR